MTTDPKIVQASRDALIEYTAKHPTRMVNISDWNAAVYAAHQLCAAEKQVEIDALKARIATLEPQRQDREDAERWAAFRTWNASGELVPNEWMLMLDVSTERDTDKLADAARAKEPHHD